MFIINILRDNRTKGTPSNHREKRRAVRKGARREDRMFLKKFCGKI